MLTEQHCICECLEWGFSVSTPISNDCKYDFLLDTGYSIQRIQVKASHWVNKDNGTFCFSCRSNHNTKKYSRKDVDYIMTEVNDKFFLFPIPQDGIAMKTLNIDDDTYLFENMIKYI